MVVVTGLIRVGSRPGEFPLLFRPLLLLLLLLLLLFPLILETVDDVPDDDEEDDVVLATAEAEGEAAFCRPSPPEDWDANDPLPTVVVAFFWCFFMQNVEQ